jgi:hypothetical protein
MHAAGILQFTPLFFSFTSCCVKCIIILCMHGTFFPLLHLRMHETFQHYLIMVYLKCTGKHIIKCFSEFDQELQL